MKTQTGKKKLTEIDSHTHIQQLIQKKLTCWVLIRAILSS
jgi:hypothetical protein